MRADIQLNTSKPSTVKLSKPDSVKVRLGKTTEVKTQNKPDLLKRKQLESLRITTEFDEEGRSG